ncbi:MAG: cell division protein FtsZ [Bacteroidales bacterium]|jgi:cell division protein FtsZ|nr:cell division protein FtsZ [Bacteroidales bacterium]
MREKINFDNAIYGEKSSNNSIIKVIGVGGGGGNAVSHMYENGIVDVNFLICNTDLQALEHNPIPSKLVLGDNGLGAGADPDKAREFAITSREQIKEFIGKETKMLFITAGMGKGTGTGASPVVAEIAKEMGILTIGVVTYPFKFEGNKRAEFAEKGIEELKKHVDSLIVVKNQNIMKFYRDEEVDKAFAHADDVLKNAVKCIAELVSVHAIQNVDFSDVEKAMKNSGPAMLGLALASGPDRIEKVTREVFDCPLLDQSLITNAKNLLFYISCGKQAPLTILELEQLSETFETYKSPETDVIWGRNIDDSLGEDVKLAVIITNYTSSENYQQTNSIIAINKNEEFIETEIENSLPEIPIKTKIVEENNIYADLFNQNRNYRPTQESVSNEVLNAPKNPSDDFDVITSAKTDATTKVISSFNDSRYENGDNFSQLIDIPALHRQKELSVDTCDNMDHYHQNSFADLPSDEGVLYKKVLYKKALD